MNERFIKMKKRLQIKNIGQILSLCCFVILNTACSQAVPQAVNEVKIDLTKQAKTNAAADNHATSPKKVVDDNTLTLLVEKSEFLTQTPYKLLGPKEVERWEPSGVAATNEGLWVVSDREGWMTFYPLPLKKGVNEPSIMHKLKPDLKNRIKWEGLDWAESKADGTSSLLILEAISRSIWQCDQPKDGCPKLTRIDPLPLNNFLNNAVPKTFKYIMFEAVAFFQGPMIGVRGYQDSKRGLVPWSLLTAFDGKMVLDARSSITVDGKKYGVSGATFDAKREGFWLTWSYEDEGGSTAGSVAGMLSFAPIQMAKKEEESTSPKGLEFGSNRIDLHTGGLKVCTRFQLKPEGVSVNKKDELFVVFDEDLDRKAGEESDSPTTASSQRFPLLDNQDYLYTANADKLLAKCKSVKVK